MQRFIPGSFLSKYDIHVSEIDNASYEVLIEACKDLDESVPGITCEIGVRAGGSSKIIMTECKVGSIPRLHVGVDPYGNIPYKHQSITTIEVDQEGTVLSETDEMILINSLGYNEKMRLMMLLRMYPWCAKYGSIFNFINLCDEEFMTRYPDGVPFYNEDKFVINTYALVYLDGPHDTESMLKETSFFCKRVPVGGYIVIDNYKLFDLGAVEKILFEHGFKEMRRNLDKEFDDGMISYKRTENRIEEKVIVDIGANCGEWSSKMKSVYPNARFLLIEADEENESLLKDSDFDYEIALVGDENKEVTFYKGKRCNTGNSVYKENTEEFEDCDEVTLRMQRTDEILKRHNISNIDLLKIDVQGAELDVLRGMGDMIDDVKEIQIEISLTNYNEGSPDHIERLKFMKDAGFTPVNISEVGYSKESRDMIYLDMIFRRNDSD